MMFGNAPALLIVGGVAFAALTLGSSWVIARRYCRPIRRVGKKAPADYHLPFEAATFHSDGVPLHGWFIPPEASTIPVPAVVLAHGWSLSASQMLPLARALHAAGFATLLYNARGHGDSGKDGPITIVKFAEDMTAAVEYLTGRTDVDRDRLGAVGHSLGGSAAIVAASIDPRLRAVVAIAAFADPEALTADYLRALHIPRWPFLWLVTRFVERWLGTSMAAVAPRNRIHQVGGSLLLIHGNDDRYVLPANLEALLRRAAPERTETWLVAARGHWDVVRHPKLGPRLVRFFETHLARA